MARSCCSNAIAQPCRNCTPMRRMRLGSRYQRRLRRPIKECGEFATSHGRARGSGSGIVAAQTCTGKGPVHVRFGSKADICGATSHVCFAPDSDRESGLPQKVMSALSGHRRTYSITSSAVVRSDGGTVRLRAFAVLRLIARSNLVGCSTGKSSGLSPFNILSTYLAARR